MPEVLGNYHLQEKRPRTCHPERSEGSQTTVGKVMHLKTQDFLRLANPHCKSNFKKKPALCEQQLLLAANKDKEWGMFERWIILLLLFREQRVTPFPYLLR